MRETALELRRLLRIVLDPDYWLWRMNEWTARMNESIGRTDEKLDRILAEQRERWHIRLDEER